MPHQIIDCSLKEFLFDLYILTKDEKDIKQEYTNEEQKLIEEVQKEMTEWKDIE